MRKEAALLRITIVETPSEQKWVLQGRLIGPWAQELRSNWNRAHGQSNGRSCVVDLSQVTFIDSDGERVLTKMRKEGADFVVSGLYATHVIQNVEARCRTRQGK